MKKYLNRYKSYIITTIIAIFIIAILMMVKKLYPIGNYVLASGDDYTNQYYPYLVVFKNMMSNYEISFYTFNLGIGLPFLNIFTSYIISLFNIPLLLLIKDELLFSNIVMLIKPIFISLSMLFYLNHKNGNKSSNIIFSILYGFCAYSTIYITNIMWIDQLIYLPLLTYGIEELINKKDNRTYIAILLLVMLTNYYIAYMLCIYSLIYFSIYLFLYSKNNKKEIIINFIKSSLLCALLCSFLYIPLTNTFRNTNLLAQNYNVIRSEFNIFDFIAAHLNGYQPSLLVEESVAPNIFCGLISFVLLVIFIFNKKVDKKEKLLLLSMSVIFYLFFRMRELDYIINFFHFPNGLFYRSSFVYSFLLSIIGSISINKISHIDKKDFNKTFIIIFIFFIILGIVMPSKLDINILLLNICLVIVYYVIFRLNKKINVITFIFCIVEILLFMILFVRTSDTNTISYDNKSMISEIKSIDSGIYRIHDHLSEDGFNGSASGNYYGINNYSSLISSNVTKMFINLGLINNNVNGYVYNNNVPVFNTMFGIKYYIDDRNVSSDYFDKISNNIYKNKYFKSLAYSTNIDLLKLDINQDNPVDIYNDYVYLSTGIENLFEELKYNTDKVKLDGTYETYIYLPSNIDKFIVNGYTYKNSKEYISFIRFDKDFAIINTNFIYFEKDKEYDIEFYYKDSNKEKVKYYKINKNKFDEFYKRIGDVSILEFNSDKIKLSYDGDNSLIYTSIPYEEGWKVFVDDKEVSKDKVMDALLAIRVEEGKHIIDIKYEEPYYNIGVYITCTILILLSINNIRVIIKDREDE